MTKAARAWLSAVRLAYHAWPAGALAMPAVSIGQELLGGPVRAFALKQVVDELRPAPVAAAVWMVVFVAGVVIGSLLGTLLGTLQDEAMERTRQHVRQVLLRASLSPPGVDHLENPAFADRVGLVLSRAEVAANVFANGSVLLTMTVTVGFAVVVLGRVQPLLPVLMLGAVPGAMLRAWALRRELSMMDRAASDQRLAGRLSELLADPAAAKEIRLLGLADHLLERFRDVTDRAIVGLARARRAQVGAAAVGGLLQGLMLAAGVGLLAYLTLTGRASAGDLVMGIALLRGLLDDAVSLVQKSGRTAEQVFVAERLLSLVDHQSPVRAPVRSSPAPSQLSQGITFEGVSFRYRPDGADVLRRVNLHLPAGSTVALVGDNGAGKTSLVKLLCRFYDPTEGRILIDGVDLRALDPDLWRARLTAVFQDFVRFEFLAGETIGVGDVRHVDDLNEVTRASLSAGAAPVVEALPRGYATQLGRQMPEGVELSIGQWQKVSLARSAMRMDPLLSILDEPTASLDPRAEHELFERYAAAATGSARQKSITLLVSHRFSTVRMADTIAVLQRGELVEIGSHTELMARSGVYARLFSLQAGAYA